MQDLELVWSWIAPRQELSAVARRVAADLGAACGQAPSGPFCLWLVGGLGAGKTTFTGELLRVLGLPEGIPVTSPTYTYMNEYRIGAGTDERWYAHLDLYRAAGRLDPSELGVFDARPFRGVIVEWPERLGDPEALSSTHLLQIDAHAGGESRLYTLHHRSLAGFE